MKIISNCYIKNIHTNTIEDAFFVLRKKEIMLTTKNLQNNNEYIGIESTLIVVSKNKKEWYNTQDVLERLEKVSDDRIYRLKDALRIGVPEKGK